MSNFNYSWYQCGQVPPYMPHYQADCHIQSGKAATENYSPNSNSSSDSFGGTSEPILVSASVKIMCPNEKQSEHKVFMLRDIDFHVISTVDSLRDEIYSQFGKEFIDNNSDFDVGYFQGNKRIWIRNDADFKELAELFQIKPTTLWCNGRTKRKTKKKQTSDSSDSEEDHVKPKKKKNASKEREDRVDDVVDELRLKHQSKFSSLQYRVWAETVVCGRHVSLTCPPRGSYFNKHTQSPEKTVNPSSSVVTPIKAADLKSTYIKQIKELHSLFEIGAITEADFQKQKLVILDQMDKL